MLALDRLFNRLYTARFNPIYQSGALAVLCLFVLVATGLYLLIFYTLASPYESVAALEQQWWGGRWIRALHFYAGDTMLVAVAVHAVRMLLQGRTWGPRALAWVSGVAMLGIVLFSGWTGMVLVWDVQGRLVAMEGARLLDTLPLFSEPIRRIFLVEDGVGSGFFFLNLMLHMVFPVALLFALWLHTVRVARPAVLPPRRLSLWVLSGLLGLALVRPVGLLAPADPLALAGTVPTDVFYGFWLPVARTLPPLATLGAFAAAALLLVSVPWWWRPRRSAAPEPSASNEELCTGCRQCYLDCPYEAISMVPAPPTNTATEVVARVDPALCTACGICAGSCAPMVIGPPGRTGRDHLVAAQRLYRERQPGAEEIVVVACAQGLADALAGRAPDGVVLHPLHCVGDLHTSAVEYLLRRGVGGVYLLGCPPRDCLYREGPKWMEQRLFADREAELHERVDKRRVRLAAFGRGERNEALADLTAFAALVQRLNRPWDEGDVDIDLECDPPEVSHG